MRLIRDDDNVLPRAQPRHRFALFRHELVDRGEHHAAARPVQRLAQMLAPLGLERGLAENVYVALELAEKLVVEIVTITQSPWPFPLAVFLWRQKSLHCSLAAGQTFLHRHRCV